jgi:hypothetical protein
VFYLQIGVFSKFFFIVVFLVFDRQEGGRIDLGFDFGFRIRVGFRLNELRNAGFAPLLQPLPMPTANPFRREKPLTVRTRRPSLTDDFMMNVVGVSVELILPREDQVAKGASLTLE